MRSEHPYRPCPSCGGVEFDSFPDLAFELRQASQMAGLTVLQKIPGGLVHTLVVCSGCGKTDVYTKNAQALRERCKNVSHFRAIQR